MSEIAIRGCLEDPNPVQLGLIHFHKHPAGAPLRDIDPPAIEKLREYIAGQRRRCSPRIRGAVNGEDVMRNDI